MAFSDLGLRRMIVRTCGSDIASAPNGVTMNVGAGSLHTKGKVRDQ
jgi:hypothetical protein